MYIAVYNTDSKMRRQLIEQELESMFASGVSIKEGVYLLPEQEGIGIRNIVQVFDKNMSNGDAIYISKLGNNRAYVGFPRSLKEWLNSNN